MLVRSSFYYQPKAETALNLSLMRLLNEDFTRHNFKGVCGLRNYLRLAGCLVNEKRVRRLVRLMIHKPVYPKTRLSCWGGYPYLLRERPITAPNEVWSTDITYISMVLGFLYLTAVFDWRLRYVLSRELSNTLDVGFCLQALSSALRQAPILYIFNSDQGIPFTYPPPSRPYRPSAALAATSRAAPPTTTSSSTSGARSKRNTFTSILLTTDLLPFTGPVDSGASGVLKLDSNGGRHYLIGR